MPVKRRQKGTPPTLKRGYLCPRNAPPHFSILLTERQVLEAGRERRFSNLRMHGRAGMPIPSSLRLSSWPSGSKESEV
ncbi:MAG: hypothetical protein D6679_04795 [Candidatus Hydrogenedentota bacterium]|nr:MAG: hypothetical protein D6679_04795 [Candidatus Hydrogenedentota bacterium]